MSSLINTLALIQQKITLYVYPIYIIFGVTGCLLNLVVFSRPKLRTTSFSVYFFAASVAHLLTFIVGIGPVIYSLNNPNPQTQSLVFCKIRNYLFQVFTNFARWFVAFACIDRYALTSDQVRLRNFAQPKTVYRVIILIIIICSIICCQRLIFYQISNNTCSIVNIGASLYQSTYVILGGCVFPTIIMTVCTYLIRRNLARKRQKRTQFSLDNHQRTSLDQQVLKMLFIQIICFMIFIIPQLGNLVFGTISITIPNRSSDHLAVERFVTFMAEVILYLFPVTSFYLYTLTSRTFRSELVKWIRSLLICFRKNEITPMTDVTNVASRLGNQQKMGIVTGNRIIEQHNIKTSG